MKRKSLFILQLVLLLCLSVRCVYASVTLNYYELTIGINSTQTLKANSTSGSVSWSSSNQNIATVDESGIVTGISPGIAYIYAKSNTETVSCKITVSSVYIPIQSIMFNESDGTISVNETKKLNVTITPSNASNKSLSFTSSNNQIVTVDSNGIITGRKAGTAYINVMAENHNSSYKVTVVDTISLKGISTPSNIELKENDTGKINVTYNPNNATNKKVTYKSSNTGIVTVDSNGNLKAISAGSATITIVSNDGGHVATTKVTVNAIDKSLKGISLNKTELKMEIGATEKLVINYNPSNAENKKVKWTSSDSKIVKVEDGTITAIKPGTVEIKAVSDEGNHEAICKVSVISPPIEAIAFVNEEETVYVGSTTTLKTVSTPTDTIINDPLWTSSDETIATVKNGVVTALKIGETVVTISDKDGKISASTVIKVIAKPEEKLMINVEGYDLNFDPEIMDYTLSIGNEDSLVITTNINEKKVNIGGNHDLKNGSIITVTISGTPKKTYVINIRKKQNNPIVFIIIITILLIINIVRMLIKNKKSSKRF